MSSPSNEYVWDVELQCGHHVTVTRFVPGLPAPVQRCFDCVMDPKVDDRFCIYEVVDAMLVESPAE
jgi:hypothetical protein